MYFSFQFNKTLFPLSHLSNFDYKNIKIQFNNLVFVVDHKVET